MGKVFNLKAIEDLAASDDWDSLPRKELNRYIQALRSITRLRSVLPATKDRAKTVLRSKGIPLRPPSETRGPSEPDAMVRSAKEARDRGMVKRQRKILAKRLEQESTIRLDDPPRTVELAARQLIHIGEAAVLFDEMVRFERGNCRKGEIKRRIRRILTIAPMGTRTEETI